MPISVTCGACEKTYTVKETAAGKTFRCKHCNEPITVPQGRDEADSESDAWEITEGAEAPRITPRRRPARETAPEKTARSKRPSGPGIPITIILAILIEGLFLALNGFNLLSSLSHADVNLVGIAGLCLRILLEIAVAVGLWQRRHLARTAGMILSGIGLALVVVCGGVALILGSQEQIAAQVGVGGRALFVAILAVQAILFGGQIVLLMSNSAADYCDR